MLVPASDSGPAMQPVFIQIENLCRKFTHGNGAQVVLAGLSFTLRRGEIVALLGRSGSGKSTLLNLISGIDRADSGRVVIDGKDLTAMNERERTMFRRLNIGFIYQFFNLIPSLTAAENIALILELNGRSPELAMKSTQRLLEAMQLVEQGSHFPAELSGGEQQRIALARAMIHAPKLVLADEPTGNLDAETGVQMLQLLKANVNANNSTLLLVTHSLAVARTADRILTLDRGVIEERSGDFAW
jgi:putative ABC transport system ATP-binding protein